MVAARCHVETLDTGRHAPAQQIAVQFAAGMQGDGMLAGRRRKSCGQRVGNTKILGHVQPLRQRGAGMTQGRVDFQGGHRSTVGQRQQATEMALATAPVEQAVAGRAHGGGEGLDLLPLAPGNLPGPALALHGQRTCRIERQFGQRLQVAQPGQFVGEKIGSQRGIVVQAFAVVVSQRQ